MGLDITAYSRLTTYPNTPVDDDGYCEEDGVMGIHTVTLQWTEENWPGRAAPLTAGHYRYEALFQFRAGSYSGYNQWRDKLSRLATGLTADQSWRSQAPPTPFLELIHFADNEGYIGPIVADKLARDFAENQDRIFAVIDDSNDDWFKHSYANWRKAFEMAANSGVVSFH